tara:strand:- start:60 stop:2534 length:2475 start_codon:yes stop_codon:yes gene_type:complete
VKRNKFSKALKHLKSKKIDDKIKSLEEAGPTNSMSGVYQVTPDTGDGFRMGPGDPEKKFYPKQDGTWPSGIPANASDTVYVRKGGYFDSGKGTVPTNQVPVSRDFSYDDVTANGTTNTNTLIRPSDGKPYTALPEGTESFILGPLVGNYAINHGYDDFTNIGYIQKDTRQFVLLARIDGFFKGDDRNSGNARTFDGTESQFTSYNSNFKLEHALWMLDRYNKSDFADNFPFNFSGGVPVERHPDNNSMGMGVIMGILNALFGGNSDNIGTPQDPADSNDIESLDLWGILKPGFNLGLELFEKIANAADAFNSLFFFNNAAEFLADVIVPPKVTSAEDFNNTLLSSLINSIITGKQHKMDVDDKGKQDMVNNIDPAKFEENAEVRPPSNDDVDNLIKPTNKKDDTFKPDSPWSDQGGTETTIDPDTGDVTIHSQKTLRTSKDDPYGKDDIPNISPEKLKEVLKDRNLEEPIKNFYDIISKIPGVSGNMSSKEAADAMYEGLTGPIQEAIYGFIVEGGAANVVKIREAILNMGAEKSPVEKDGGGKGHVTTTVTIPNDKLSDALKEIVNKKLNSSKNESYIMESKKRILREITQPLKEIKELPKTTKLKGYKPNFKGKFSPQNTPDVTASNKSDEIVSGKNASRQIWTAKDKYWKGYETTERMNIVYDRVGHGSQYFDRVVAGNILDKKKREKNVQEHLNVLAHEKALREVYGITESPFRKIEESETYDNKVNDPLFSKVANRLKKEIDYPKKPSPKGYPNEAPPKIDPNTGMHPKFGKRYKYDKLDPQSAEGMPMQGDPEIDANIEKATDSKRKARKLKNLLGKK